MSGGSTNLGNSLENYAPSFDGYAPADFGDADDTRPLPILLDPTGSGSSTPYSTLITNAVARHMHEIKEKTIVPQTAPINFRRKIREFMGQQNDDLTSFLRKPLSQHPTLGSAENFMKTFGKMEFQTNHATLKNILLDASGTNGINIIEEEMKEIGPANLQQLAEQVRWLYEEYKKAGDSILQNEGFLRAKLSALNENYQKILGFVELPVNNDTAELSAAVQKYMEKVFKENDIQPHYTAMIESYRRFAALKEAIQLYRFTDLMDKEPLCSICLTDTVAYTVSPCGHTFCANCCKRQMIQCYSCRGQIRERIKIYFG